MLKCTKNGQTRNGKEWIFQMNPFYALQKWGETLCIRRSGKAGLIQHLEKEEKKKASNRNSLLGG